MSETREEIAKRLLRQVMECEVYPDEQAVLEAAMRAAVDVTHEVGDPDATDAAIISTFLGAVRVVPRR